MPSQYSGIPMILNLEKTILQKIKNPSQHDHFVDIVRSVKKRFDEIKANNYLSGFAKNVASQGGEVGVLQKILETIGIKSPGWCVEFGACDGKLDSNTWNLVKN